MNATIYLFPGTFSPPTYGHLEVVKKAAALCEKLTVICSRNADKRPWFTPEKCTELWLSYNLPENVEVATFAEFAKRGHDTSKIVMVRGIRNEDDLAHENKVILLNRNDYGINNYLYILTDPKFEHISSSAARDLADKLDFDGLSNMVSPMVITALLEKCLDQRNVVLVVGRPASGKSTILNRLTELDTRNIHINTDEFNHQLREFLKEKFGEADLLKIAETNESELLKITAKPWFDLLRSALCNAPKGSNIFVEAAYGLQDNKQLYRFIGGKILSIGCKDVAALEQRLIDRGTPNIKQFLRKIPDMDESIKIAAENRLEIISVETDGPVECVANKATLLDRIINKEETLAWKTGLLGDRS